MRIFFSFRIMLMNSAHQKVVFSLKNVFCKGMKHWQSFQNFASTLRGIYLNLKIMLNSNFGK